MEPDTTGTEQDGGSNGEVREGETGRRDPREPRLNAMRHGLTARAVLLREEEAEEFLALRDDFFRQWCPAGETECAQVHEMAEAQWRLLRCTPMESELLETLRDPEAPVGGLAAAFLGGHKGDGGDLLRLARYRRTIERSFDRALHNLLLLHRVRGVWSKPNLEEPEDEENWEAPPSVNERWCGDVTHAQPRPQRDDNGNENEFGNVTVTVERVIIGDDGEQIPGEEYHAREKAAREKAAREKRAQESGAAAEPDEPPATAGAGGPERPKADILRNGPPVADEHADAREFSETLSRVPRDRRRY
jgi:hypothetical protein